MASLEVKGHDLVVHLSGWDKLLALRGSLTVPLAHITDVRAHPEEAAFDDHIVNSTRGIGCYFPGTLAVGTVELRDGQSFFDVHHPEKAIAIDLQGERLRHIVVELDDERPEEAAERLLAAIRDEEQRYSVA